MDDLLTLKAAAEHLGVHPVTLRRWSEDGKIETIRTPGGHRRFPMSEIVRLRSRASDQPGLDASFRERAMTQTRADLKDVQSAWAVTANEDELEEKRLLGRRLMGLLMQYVAAADGEGADVLDEARVVARIYAKGIVASGVSLSDALRATNFFKDHILESAVVLPDSSSRRPESNRRVFRRLNEFLNEIQLVIADAYKK